MIVGSKYYSMKTEYDQANGGNESPFNILEYQAPRHPSFQLLWRALWGSSAPMGGLQPPLGASGPFTGPRISPYMLNS